MKRFLIVEPEAVKAASEVFTTNEVIAPPFNGTSFKDSRVTLWPSATMQSREGFNKIADSLRGIAKEIYIIIPNNQPEGWSIASAVKEGWDKQRLSEWARAERIEIPSIKLEVHEAADPQTPDIYALWRELGLACNGNGQAIPNADNVNRVLNQWQPLKGRLYYDEFHQRIFFKDRRQKAQIWTNADTTSLLIRLQRELGLTRLGEGAVFDAVTHTAHATTTHEPREWVRHLKWDGKPRIDSCLINYFGTADTPYSYAVSRNLFLGLMARIHQPGCILRHMAILEGPQESGKSTALAILGGPWYLDAGIDITSKDFYIAMAGKWLIEISELDAMSRADETKVKQVISCRVDRYRAPYDRIAEDHPRQCVFVGTTNEAHYLRDATGATRFWPVKCGAINLEAIREQREQLFAEARTRYLAGETYWETPKDETVEQQESRYLSDAWIEPLREWAGIQSEAFDLIAAAKCVGITSDKLDMRVQKRLGSILRKLGYENMPVKENGYSARKWKKYQI